MGKFLGWYLWVGKRGWNLGVGKSVPLRCWPRPHLSLFLDWFPLHWPLTVPNLASHGFAMVPKLRFARSGAK